MPTIAVFYGILVQMYWRNRNPPHIHAAYQGLEGLFEIATDQMIQGRFSKGAKRMVSEWVVANRAALLENSERGRLQQPFEQLPGPDEDE